MMKRSICAALFGMTAASLTFPANAATCPPVPRQAVTQELETLMQVDPSINALLHISIQEGQKINGNPVTNPVANIPDYLDYIDALVTYDPRNIQPSFFLHDPITLAENIAPHMDGKNYCNWNLLDLLSYGFFLVDQQIETDPYDRLQFSSGEFAFWMPKVADAWAVYLDTPASAAYIPTEFFNDPEFRINDYVIPAGGFSSFNEFFTRQVKPGARPIDSPTDPKVVTSIGDSQSRGAWPISRDGKLPVDHEWPTRNGYWIKGMTYHNVHEFILGAPQETILQSEGSIDPNLFNNGVFTHQFLNVNDYHRLHTPVAGKVVFIRHLKGAARMQAAWDRNAQRYSPQDGPEWQFPQTEKDNNWRFGQTRLVFGIDTKYDEHGNLRPSSEDYGVVLAIPMGMAQVSGIQMRNIHVGDFVGKGQEFSNFAFGGSDFVVIFEPKAGFELTVPRNETVSTRNGTTYQHRLMGQKYGCFNGAAPTGTCSQ